MGGEGGMGGGQGRGRMGGFAMGPSGNCVRPKCDQPVQRRIGVGSGVISKGFDFCATDHKDLSAMSPRCGRARPYCGRITPCETKTCQTSAQCEMSKEKQWLQR